VPCLDLENLSCLWLAANAVSKHGGNFPDPASLEIAQIVNNDMIMARAI
jgi:hypothetical protein